MCPRSIAGVPSSQALPGYLITVPPSVCVPDAIGALAVWIQKQKKRLCPCVITPRGFTSLPTQEAKYSFSGLIPTNKQTNKQRDPEAQAGSH